MRIKLIAPNELTDGNISSAQTFAIRKVNLALLAALTPAEHEVMIVDEAFAPDDPDQDVDLVGITVMTDLVVPAYRIAAGYRRRGVRVVMGGIHPTVLPDEALQHADAVVAGEGETLWPRVVADAAAGNLQRLYRAWAPTPLAGLPQPRWDLYPRRNARSYTPAASGLETARGCPYSCEFCSIASVMGRRHRVRPVAEVFDEITASGNRQLFFVDDALALNRPVATALFRGMAPLGLKWAGQGTVSLAEDVNLLRLMKRSGCVGVLLGFESVQSDRSGGMNKLKHLRIDFAEAMRRFHGEGIAVMGAFVFGFDHDNADVFDQTLEFVTGSRLDVAELRILTPFPGTPLYARLREEGRLFAPDWWLRGYPPDTLLFCPRGMTPDQLVEGFVRLNRQIYSLGSILRRFFGMDPLRRGAFGSAVYAGLNIATRQRYLNGIAIPQPFVEHSGEAPPCESSNCWHEA
jgi:radical SAM superfamily enzyme YgiQ (UPF0313 family)